MASEIDPSVFPDNLKVDKADLREQFQIAGNEITELQSKTSVPGVSAFSFFDVDTDMARILAQQSSMNVTIISNQRKIGVPYQMAFNTALFIQV